MQQNDSPAPSATGIDIGGTKVHILDDTHHAVRHYDPHQYPDLYAVLDDYFGGLEKRPGRVMLAVAGPRDDVSGIIKMSNNPWPAINPREAEARYPGTRFETCNDMIGTVAGVVAAHADSFKLLKEGVAVENGNKVVVSISTGFGVGVAALDRVAGRYTYIESEAGHSGFQPYNEVQSDFLNFLYTKHTDPSWELALSGKYGIDSWLEFLSPKLHAPALGKALERAMADGRPRGAVLLEFALEGTGADQEAAHTILDYMGCLVANALSNLALTFKTSGGIFLTGSVSLALAEYWAERTGFADEFLKHGTPDHAPWLETFLTHIPVYLVTDPHIAAKGALFLTSL